MVNHFNTKSVNLRMILDVLERYEVPKEKITIFRGMVNVRIALPDEDRKRAFIRQLRAHLGNGFMVVPRDIGLDSEYIHIRKRA